ncbi:MAG: aldo/keto reductase [Spirochaetaceae bacterium]|nr:MAG: aldo/keto reductase [Spirochaetaceae bacterium]
MDYNVLGRTGLTVSAIGVGTGGPSRVGLRGGGSRDESVGVVRLALDSGVNFIDTAEAYDTEDVVARAIDGVKRDTLVLSTKISSWDSFDTSSARAAERAVTDAVDSRLRALGTDYIDVCHFHGVQIDSYDTVADRLLPGLLRAREAGKVRFIGITEAFNADPDHRALARALDDEHWDVMMVGFNILNQSARERVFPRALANGVGVLGMFAVRLALSRVERLRDVIGDLLSDGSITRDELEAVGGTPDDPLGWVVRESDAESLVDAAYRLVRHEEAMHVTLSGTGSAEHLMANIESIQRPPLPPHVTDRLSRLFARVDHVSGQ